MLLGAQGSNDKGIQVLKRGCKIFESVYVVYESVYEVEIFSISFEKHQVRNVPMCTIQRGCLRPENSGLKLSKMGKFGLEHLYFNCCIKKNKKGKSSEIDQIVYFFQMLLQQTHQIILFCNYTISSQNIPV